jgi:hypothetical protein
MDLRALSTSMEVRINKYLTGAVAKTVQMLKNG